MKLFKTTYHETIRPKSIDYIKCTLEYLLPDGTNTTAYFTFCGDDTLTTGAWYSYKKFLESKNF